MLFFSFFKTLVNHEVTVELKNDISIRGTLKSVDQYLNIKLDDITVVEELKYPHLVRLFGAMAYACFNKWEWGGRERAVQKIEGLRGYTSLMGNG